MSSIFISFFIQTYIVYTYLFYILLIKYTATASPWAKHLWMLPHLARKENTFDFTYSHRQNKPSNTYHTCHTFQQPPTVVVGYGGCGGYNLTTIPLIHWPWAHQAKSLQGDQISAYHLTAAAARGDERWCACSIFHLQTKDGGLNSKSQGSKHSYLDIFNERLLSQPIYFEKKMFFGFSGWEYISPIGGSTLLFLEDSILFDDCAIFFAVFGEKVTN